VSAVPPAGKPAPIYRERTTELACACGAKLVVRVPGFATCQGCGLFYGVAHVALDTGRNR
jgi:predicted nucleotidyltransferase